MAWSRSDPYTSATMDRKCRNFRPVRSQIGLPLIALVLCLLCLCGCVRRRMTIRTNPPGAMVYVDDYPIGTTPVSTNFVHYGTRELRIIKDGYEPLTVQQPIPAPWYEYPPIDFFAENVVPTEIRDHRTLNYQLVPQRVVPPDELRGRAEDLRARASGGVVVTGANVVQPPVYGYGAPGTPTPAEPIPSPPPSGYGYPPPAGQPIPTPPPTLPPSVAPQLPPGLRTLPQGGMPIR